MSQTPRFTGHPTRDQATIGSAYHARVFQRFLPLKWGLNRSNGGFAEHKGAISLVEGLKGGPKAQANISGKFSLKIKDCYPLFFFFLSKKQKKEGKTL